MSDDDQLDKAIADQQRDLEKAQIEEAERRRVGVAAANQYLIAFFTDTDSESRRSRLNAFEYVATHVCGLGTPYNTMGEDDRAREFLGFPELSFHRTTLAARRLRGEGVERGDH